MKVGDDVCLDSQRLYVCEGHMLIRVEKETDLAGVHDVNVSAFETSAEANLVGALREQAKPIVSLVAEDNGVIVGHIMFSPVSLADNPNLKVMALAPIAVVPRLQGQGMGSALVWEGLEQCRQLGFVGVVVLGHPRYYHRFGFFPSTRFGIYSEYEVPEEVFMAMELQSEALSGKTGRVKFHVAFNSL